jgi:hypothetical protein
MRRPKDQVELDKETCGECKVTVCLFPRANRFVQIQVQLDIKVNRYLSEARSDNTIIPGACCLPAHRVE